MKDSNRKEAFSISQRGENYREVNRTEFRRNGW